MTAARYTARMGESVVAEGADYDSFVVGIVRYVAEAAVARYADRSEWEHEELRRRGLSALEMSRDGRAVWRHQADFESERGAALAQGREAAAAFDAANELDLDFCTRLDADVQKTWRRAGYEAPSMLEDMRPLFAELERDAADRAASALAELVNEIVRAQES